MGTIQNKDIDFVSNYWKELNRICNNIDKLKFPENIFIKKGGSKLYFINYSNLENWDARLLFNNDTQNLLMLKTKLKHMIMTGKGYDVKIMLEKICSGRTRTFRFKEKNNETINCGHGSFRIGSCSFTLTNDELLLVREFFNYKN